jgi:hypothetical protein
MYVFMSSYDHTSLAPPFGAFLPSSIHPSSFLLVARLHLDLMDLMDNLLLVASEKTPFSLKAFYKDHPQLCGEPHSKRRESVRNRYYYLQKLKKDKPAEYW